MPPRHPTLPVLSDENNVNGLTDFDETTLFVSLKTAQQIMERSPADLRYAPLKESIAAWLMIKCMPGDSTATNSNQRAFWVELAPPNVDLSAREKSGTAARMPLGAALRMSAPDHSSFCEPAQ